MAQETIKNPYLFDFMTLEEPFHERELETGLIAHLEKFLLELGAGFASVGRQYHLEVSEQVFYIDLLFYHLKLRCYVVIELKRGKFKPEYAGKMNFYCSAVDDKLRHEHDNPTIGLILCQANDKIIAEYALKDVNKSIGISEYELTRALPTVLNPACRPLKKLKSALRKNPETFLMQGCFHYGPSSGKSTGISSRKMSGKTMARPGGVMRNEKRLRIVKTL